MALQGADLAILAARFGVARFGASRFGFIPCPEDVEGVGTAEPGEYIWKEVIPPTTAWTLVDEDCVCRELCTLALGSIFLTIDGAGKRSGWSSLSGVKGLVDGIIRVSWGDGGHGEYVVSPLINDDLFLAHDYNANGTYTLTMTVTDERGCVATRTRAVVIGDFP